MYEYYIYIYFQSSEIKGAKYNAPYKALAMTGQKESQQEWQGKGLDFCVNLRVKNVRTFFR